MLIAAINANKTNQSDLKTVGYFVVVVFSSVTLIPCSSVQANYALVPLYAVCPSSHGSYSNAQTSRSNGAVIGGISNSAQCILATASSTATRGSDVTPAARLSLAQRHFTVAEAAHRRHVCVKNGRLGYCSRKH